MPKLIFLLFLTVTLFFQCQERCISGKVVKVADGDTFTLLTEQNQQIRVRLHGIDAPEKSQDFYRVAKSHLADLIMDKTVEVHWKKKDQYGRMVAIVYLDKLRVNEELLKAGLVWHFREYDNNPEWQQLESTARRNRMGIWSHPNPIPPWQFRKEKRKQHQRLP